MVVQKDPKIQKLIVIGRRLNINCIVYNNNKI
jgi:hypothetical protein